MNLLERTSDLLSISLFGVDCLSDTDLRILQVVGHIGVSRKGVSESGDFVIQTTRLDSKEAHSNSCMMSICSVAIATHLIYRLVHGRLCASVVCLWYSGHSELLLLSMSKTVSPAFDIIEDDPDIWCTRWSQSSYRGRTPWPACLVSRETRTRLPSNEESMRRISSEVSCSDV